MLTPRPTGKLALGGEFAAGPFRCPPARDPTWRGSRKEAQSQSWGFLWVLPGCRGQDTAATSGQAEGHSPDSTPKPEALL